MTRHHPIRKLLLSLPLALLCPLFLPAPSQAGQVEVERFALRFDKVLIKCEQESGNYFRIHVDDRLMSEGGGWQWTLAGKDAVHARRQSWPTGQFLEGRVSTSALNLVMNGAYGSRPKAQWVRQERGRAVIVLNRRKTKIRRFAFVMKYAAWLRVDTGSFKSRLDLGRRLAVRCTAAGPHAVKLRRLGRNVFHLRRSAWTGYYLKVNTKTRKVYKVTGGTFGASGGQETELQGVQVKINDEFPAD